MEENKMSFEECFKKHFPISYQIQSMLLSREEDASIEKQLLKQVDFYDGTYELEESLMGAFIMFVILGKISISGLDINQLINNCNLSNEFLYDVKNNLLKC
ncbi:hypothetical protein FC764_16940 [Clostridium botulinum]|nr:hypothetical protein [Clostridium botulinum]